MQYHLYYISFLQHVPLGPCSPCEVRNDCAQVCLATFEFQLGRFVSYTGSTASWCNIRSIVIALAFSCEMTSTSSNPLRSQGFKFLHISRPWSCQLQNQSAWPSSVAGVFCNRGPFFSVHPRSRLRRCRNSNKTSLMWTSIRMGRCMSTLLHTHSDIIVHWFTCSLHY